MEIKNYHFHLYYALEESEIAKARAVLEELAVDKPGTEIGRIWEKPVGPHPEGSCQVSVLREDFSEMMEWFLEKRQGLSLFIHPNTGNDLEDHTQHTIWLGKEYSLNTEMFG